MKTPNKSSLMEFYFGTVDDAQRLQIERELLQDTELLLNYLDLKREIEKASLVPQEPSVFLWKRLQRQSPKKKIYLAVAASLTAAALAGVYFLTTGTSTQQPSFVADQILFDSSAEHSLTSDVL